MVAENMTTWTEVDPNNKLSQSVSQAIWANMTRNEVCYLYKAHTTPAEFAHALELNLTSIDVNADASTNFLSHIWVVCENYGRPDFVDVGKCIKLVVMEKGSSTTEFNLYLSHKNDVVQDMSIDLDVGTDYYLIIEKVGAVVTVKIYSDRTHDTLVDTLTIDLTGEDEENMSFSYVETTASDTTGGDVTDQSDGTITYMDLNYVEYAGGSGGGKIWNPSTYEEISFARILEWEESIRKPIPEKPVYGRDIPTPEAESYQVLSCVVVISARMNTSEKEAFWSVYNDHNWLELWDDNSKVDDVWMEEPRFRWDSSLGCGDRPWICTVTFICKTT